MSMSTREKIIYEFEKEFKEFKEDLINLGYDYDEVINNLLDKVDLYSK